MTPPPDSNGIAGGVEDVPEPYIDLITGKELEPWAKEMMTSRNLSSTGDGGMANIRSALADPRTRRLLRGIVTEKTRVGGYPDTMGIAENAYMLALAAAPDPTARTGVETWASIAKWCEDTFGPVTLARTAERANEEMRELLAEPENVIEAADVLIVLSRYSDLWDAVERKMAINRARRWDVRGDGTGYHIPDALPLPGEAS